MGDLLGCPDEASYARLMRGELSVAQVEPLSHHLEGCPHCLERVRKLPHQDILVEDFRASVVVFQTPTPPFVDQLKHHLRLLTPGSVRPPDWPAEPPPRQVGRYVIQRLLGRGGMGSVYEAFDPELNRKVAVKVPRFAAVDDAAARQRFLREGRAAAQVRHPNVCPIFDVGEDEGRPFVVMALIDGPSLAELLDRVGRVEPRQAVALVRRAVEGLAAIHAQGLLHRDLKPGNILLQAPPNTPDPLTALDSVTPVITDFGLARPVASNVPLTVDGYMLGTPWYMSPEQAAGDNARLGAASDIYSLGVVLYEMVVGRLPFEGSVLEVLAKIREGTFPRPRAVREDLDPHLETILLRAMAYRPQGRFGSAQQLASALDDWHQGRRRRRRFHPWLSRAAAVLLCLGVLGLLLAPTLRRVFTEEGERLTHKWVAKKPLPVPMFAARAAVARGGLFLVGGANDDASLDGCYLYDSVGDRWSARPSLPKTDAGEAGRYSGSLAALGPRLYLPGGWRKDPPLPTDTLLVYDVKAARWETRASLPSRSGSSGAAVALGKLYLLSGWDGHDGWLKCFFVYDPAANRWQSLKSPPRGHIEPAMGAIDGKIYVAGGSDVHGTTAALDVYDPKTDTWTTKSPMPTARDTVGGAVFKDKFYVVGGSVKNRPVATVECYDPLTDEWTTLPPLPSPRSHAAVAVLDKTLYVMGGSPGRTLVEALRLEP